MSNPFQIAAAAAAYKPITTQRQQDGDKPTNSIAKQLGAGIFGGTNASTSQGVTFGGNLNGGKGFFA